VAEHFNRVNFGSAHRSVDAEDEAEEGNARTRQLKVSKELKVWRG
jgi:hypothetical protein